MDTQKTINEIIELLDILWEDYPTSTQAEVDAKENLRQRIEALQQNRSSEEISLRAWTELSDTVLKEKIEFTKKLAEEKKKTKSEKTAKEAKETELATAKKKIAEKLTPELITKLEALAEGKDGQLSEEAKAEIKKITDALKEQKPATVSFTEADTKKLASELKKEAPTNYWSIGACVMGAVSLIASLFLVVKKTTEEK